MNKLNIYTCGPTVYDEAHLGHAKTYICADLIVRSIKLSGTKTNYLMNITDIDDKIINKSVAENVCWKDLARKHEKSFFQTMEKLNILIPNTIARVTDTVT